MAVGQVSEGIKLQVAMWMQKLQDSTDYAGRGKALVKDVNHELEYTKALIGALPSVERYYYNKTRESWKQELKKLDDRLDEAKAKVSIGFNRLKEVLGLQGLGIAPLIVFAIIGTIVASIGILWNETVNKTRSISAENKKLQAVLEGKLPADVLKKLRAGGGLLDWAKALPAIAIGIGLLMVLPKLRSSRR